jgi:thiosulfate/3-mercaptopyruvate sulfurtransferase
MSVTPLISAAELATKIEQDVVVIDTRSPEEYAVGHIPGAVNIREIFTYLATSTPEGLTLLQTEFATLIGNAGIVGTESIVIYEDAMNQGFGQSCRGYFLMSYFGCPDVSVLHGGYQAWLAAALPTTTLSVVPIATTFTPQINPAIMVTTAAMLAALDDPSIIKLDVRDRDEWMGESSSPYGPDFCPRKGRIPGAVWIEWYNFMESDGASAMFKSPAAILALCADVGITPESTVYIYCFKGSRAANALIALKEAGITNVKNYFASWNEWSRDPALPIETVAPVAARVPVAA